jgi:hypothetical protein
MNTVWGFGGARFEYDTTIDIATASGVLRFVQDANTYRTKAGTIKHIVNGWRAMAKIKLWNVTDQDAIDIVGVFDMISSANGAPLTIYPRYDSANASTLGFELICTTDIEMIDYANVAVGQYIELEFTGYELLERIPTLIDNASTMNMVDESDYQYIDDLGNDYTMN